MNQRNLSPKGLSLSQAQSISNLCFQRSQEIGAKINVINNYSKTFKYNNEVLVVTAGHLMPADIVELLMEKSKLHGCQAFLMEHIKLKDTLIRGIQKETFTHNLMPPEKPNFASFVITPMVDETWGWNQLLNDEMDEYLEQEAYSAHIGQFIHKNGKLDQLRNELPNIATLDFIEMEKDKKIPVKVIVHHSSEQLLEIHEKLAEAHRNHEQRVNYFKSKVKNLITLENARIAKENADNQSDVNAKNGLLREEWGKKFQEYNENLKKLEHEFENQRQLRIKEIASLRIQVPTRFQPIIDKFIDVLPKE